LPARVKLVVAMLRKASIAVCKTFTTAWQRYARPLQAPTLWSQLAGGRDVVSAFIGTVSPRMSEQLSR
jgi:hypothetical protein